MNAIDWALIGLDLIFIVAYFRGALKRLSRRARRFIWAGLMVLAGLAEFVDHNVWGWWPIAGAACMVLIEFTPYAERFNAD